MIRYMLDTNTIAYAKNRRPVQVLIRLLEHEPSELSISSITMTELEYGVYRSSKPAQNRMALMMFLSGISVLPFDAAAALEYGDIRHSLQSQGLVIGGNDMLIAAHSRALGLTLVTHNVREFSRVEHLQIEDWIS